MRRVGKGYGEKWRVEFAVKSRGLLSHPFRIEHGKDGARSLSAAEVEVGGTGKRRGVFVALEQRLNAGSQIEVHVGEAAGVMGHQRQTDAVVTNIDVWVMVGGWAKGTRF